MFILRRCGFALADLVTVLGLGIVAISGVLPMVQQSREAARLEMCSNQLRNIGNAVYKYSDVNKRLPLAALSFKGSLSKDEFFNPKDPNYWTKHQWTSTTACIAPYIGLKQLYDRADPLNYDYEKTVLDHKTCKSFSQFEGFYDLVYSRPSQLLCPADSKDISTRAVITLLPSFDRSLKEDGDDEPYYAYWVGWSDSDGYENSNTPGRSSYMACAGVNFGGTNRPGKSGSFRGMLGLREKTRLVDFNNNDGTSNTVMMGESAGEINLQRHLPSKHPAFDRKGDQPIRRLNQTWSQGCFVRGRGSVAWEADPAIGDSGEPEDRMLGNGRFADIKGFSSLHQAGVVVLMGDGATKVVPRTIGWNPWYALCGSRDGKKVDVGLLSTVEREKAKKKAKAKRAGAKSKSDEPSKKG